VLLLKLWICFCQSNEVVSCLHFTVYCESNPAVRSLCSSLWKTKITDTITMKKIELSLKNRFQTKVCFSIVNVYVVSAIHDSAGGRGGSDDWFPALYVTVSSSSWQWWVVDWSNGMEWERSVFWASWTLLCIRAGFGPLWFCWVLENCCIIVVWIFMGLVSFLCSRYLSV